MRFRIRHATHYRYSAPVAENFNEVRLQPMSEDTQECLEFTLTTRPAATVRRYHDLHLNLVDHFYVADPHRTLDIEAHSQVVTQDPGGRYAEIGFPRARLPECQRMERCYDFLQRSEFVSLEVGIWRLAQDTVEGVEDAWQAARSLMSRIHREFTYDPGATTVNTHMLEVLERRRGVCQDFAHVMLGMCRSIGIPARYVSGYLHGDAGEGRRGDLASHAWVEVFLPDHGWLGLDPTHDQPVGEHHVKVAVGRDYADAAPIRGNFKGRATQEMTVKLEIERLDS